MNARKGTTTKFSQRDSRGYIESKRVEKSNDRDSVRTDQRSTIFNKNRENLNSLAAATSTSKSLPQQQALVPVSRGKRMTKTVPQGTRRVGYVGEDPPQMSPSKSGDGGGGTKMKGLKAIGGAKSKVRRASASIAFVGEDRNDMELEVANRGGGGEGTSVAISANTAPMGGDMLAIQSPPQQPALPAPPQQPAIAADGSDTMLDNELLKKFYKISESGADPEISILQEKLTRDTIKELNDRHRRGLDISSAMIKAVSSNNILISTLTKIWMAKGTSFSFLLSYILVDENMKLTLEDKQEIVRVLAVLELSALLTIMILKSSVDTLEEKMKKKRTDKTWTFLHNYSLALKREVQENPGRELNFTTTTLTMEQASKLVTGEVLNMEELNMAVQALVNLSSFSMVPTVFLSNVSNQVNALIEKRSTDIQMLTNKLDIVVESMHSCIANLSDMTRSDQLATISSAFIQLDNLVQSISQLQNNSRTISSTQNDVMDSLATTCTRFDQDIRTLVHALNKSASELGERITSFQASQDDLVASINVVTRAAAEASAARQSVDGGGEAMDVNQASAGAAATTYTSNLSQTEQDGFSVFSFAPFVTRCNNFDTKYEAYYSHYSDLLNILKTSSDTLANQGRFDSTRAAIYTAFFSLRNELNSIYDTFFMIQTQVYSESAEMLRELGKVNINQIESDTQLYASPQFNSMVTNASLTIDRCSHRMDNFHECVNSFLNPIQGLVKEDDDATEILDPIADIQTRLGGAVNNISILTSRLNENLDTLQQRQQQEEDRVRDIKAAVTDTMYKQHQSLYHTLRVEVKNITDEASKDFKDIKTQMEAAIRRLQQSNSNAALSTSTTQYQIQPLARDFGKLKTCFWTALNSLCDLLTEKRNTMISRFWDLSYALPNREEVIASFKSLYAGHLISIEKEARSKCISDSEGRDGETEEQLAMFMSKMRVLYMNEESMTVSAVLNRITTSQAIDVIAKNGTEELNRLVTSITAILERQIPPTQQQQQQQQQQQSTAGADELQTLFRETSKTMSDTFHQMISNNNTSISEIKSMLENCLRNNENPHRVSRRGSLVSNSSNDNYGDGGGSSFDSAFELERVEAMVPRDECGTKLTVETDLDNQSSENMKALREAFNIINKDDSEYTSKPHALLNFNEILTGTTANSNKYTTSRRPMVLDQLLKSGCGNGLEDGGEDTCTPSNNLTLFLALLTTDRDEFNPLHSTTNIKKTIEVLHDVFAGQVLGKLGCFVNPIFLKERNLNGLNSDLAFPSYMGEPVCLNSIMGTAMQLDAPLMDQLYRIFKSANNRVSKVNRRSGGGGGGKVARKSTVGDVVLMEANRIAMYNSLVKGLVTASTAILDHIHGIVLEETTNETNNSALLNDWRKRKAECNEAVGQAKIIMSTMFYTFPHTISKRGYVGNVFKNKAYNLSRTLYRQMFLFVLGMLTVAKRRVSGLLLLLSKHGRLGKQSDLSVKSFTMLCAVEKLIKIVPKNTSLEQTVNVASDFRENSAVVYKFNQVANVLAKYAIAIQTITDYFRDTFYEPFLFLESYANSASGLSVDFVDPVASSSLSKDLLNNTVQVLMGNGEGADMLRRKIKHHFQDDFVLRSRATHHHGSSNQDICENFYVQRGSLSSEHSSALDSPFILCRLFRHDQPEKALTALLVPPISMSPANMKKLISKCSSSTTNVNANGSIFTGRSSFSLASPPLFKENVAPNVNVSILGLSVPDNLHASLKQSVRKQLALGGIFEKNPNLFALAHSTDQLQKKLAQRVVNRRRINDTRRSLVPLLEDAPSSPLMTTLYENLKRKKDEAALAIMDRKFEQDRKKLRSHDNKPLYSPSITNPLFYLKPKSANSTSYGLKHLSSRYITERTATGESVSTFLTSGQHRSQKLLDLKLRNDEQQRWRSYV